MTHSWHVVTSYLIVGQRVIVEKQSWRNVERNKDVDWVMLVGGQYEEYSKHVEKPCQRVQKVQIARCVFGDEEIQQRQCHSVATEHVIAARPYALNGHSQPAPDGVGPADAQVNHLRNFGRAVVELVIVLGALQMSARDAQRRNQHRNAPQQEHGAGQGKEPTQQNHSVFMYYKHANPDAEQQRSGNFAHVESPRNVGYVIEEDIGQGWVLFHVGNALVYHHHHERRYPGD